MRLDPVKTIITRIPEYNSIVQKVGPEFLAESWYAAFVGLFDLALAASKANKRDLVTRIYRLADELLEHSDPEVSDSCAIEMFEPLQNSKIRREASMIIEVMGPAGNSYLKSE